MHNEVKVFAYFYGSPNSILCPGQVVKFRKDILYEILRTLECQTSVKVLQIFPALYA